MDMQKILKQSPWAPYILSWVYPGQMDDALLAGHLYNSSS